eukprot:551822-Hanusia_phi.AAC.2
MKGTTLELTHNYGTESDASFKYHPGNQEKDGFGHVACTSLRRSWRQLGSRSRRNRTRGA